MLDEGNNPAKHLLVVMDRLCLWAATEILTQPPRWKSDFVTQFFMSVSVELFRLQNFAAAFAIQSTFALGRIRRLVSAGLVCTSPVDRQLQKDWSDLESLCCPEKSFKAYREHIKTVALPAIPYMGLMLQDVTLIKDGNPTRLKDGSVNQAKILLLYEVSRELQRFQRGQYRLSADHALKSWIANSCCVLTEMQLWMQSYKWLP